MPGTTYSSDFLPNQFGTVYLLDVRCGRNQRLSQRVNGKLSNTRADTEGVDTVRPEKLITKERMNNCRNTS